MYKFFSRNKIEYLNNQLEDINQQINLQGSIRTGIYKIDKGSLIFNEDNLSLDQRIKEINKFIKLINQGKAELILTLQDLDTVEEIDAMEASFNDGYKHMVDKVNYEAYNQIVVRK